MIEYETNTSARRPRFKPLPPPLPGRSVWLWIASNVGWAALGLAAFVMLSAALTFGLRVLAFFSPVLAMILLTAVAALLRAVRREHARRLMLYVHQAVRLNLPIPDMLFAAEAGERGRMRARLRLLREMLLEGVAIGHAIERAAPDVPRRDVAVIAASEHLGRLPEGLDRVVATTGADATPEAAGGAAAGASATARMHLRWYPIVMFLFLGTAINVLMIFVMPKYEQLFSDFDIPMPGVTRRLVRFWAGWGGVLFTLVPLVLLVWYCGRALAQTVAPRWAAARSGFNLWDRVAWWTPVYRGVVRGRGLADGLFVAAQALSAGGTLPGALGEASAVPDNAVVRRRFARWGESVAAGVPPADAARTARMPDFVCGMVGPGVGSSQLADVVRFLARYYDTRASRAAAVIEGAAVPALSLGFGAIVGGIALAIFLPLFHLIDLLAGKGFQ